MTYRTFLPVSFTTESGVDIELDVDASLIPARPAAYGAPAEAAEVEIHAITMKNGEDCPSWLDAQIERSDHFAEKLLETLQEAQRSYEEEKADVDFDLA